MAEPGQVGERNTVYLDWLREDRGPSGNASAGPTIQDNRPYQIDHYWINDNWETLPFVLDNHEIGTTYAAPPADRAEPYPSAKAMIDDLRKVLAPLELTLAFEYLYALFSVHAPHDPGVPRAWPTLPADAELVRHYVQMVAIGEMTHLRWANQLLWELDRAGFYPKGEHYEPILELSRVIPELGRGKRPRTLRPLTRDTLQDFIDAERPGATLDRAYARCVATLEKKEYPPHLFELAVRVDTDGFNHWQRFTDLKKSLAAYPEREDPWLRPDVRVATPAEAKKALTLRDHILEAIRKGYVAEAQGHAPRAEAAILDARAAMGQLFDEADAMARDRALGVPFFDEWPTGTTAPRAPAAKKAARKGAR
jgi:hypothetical protein